MEQSCKRINGLKRERPDIPELSENCGTSQSTAVSVFVAWIAGGDLHLSMTGGSVSGDRQKVCAQTEKTC